MNAEFLKIRNEMGQIRKDMVSHEFFVKWIGRIEKLEFALHF